MIKGNSNVKSTPTRPEKRGGIRGETPTHNLQQFSKEALNLIKKGRAVKRIETNGFILELDITENNFLK